MQSPFPIIPGALLRCINVMHIGADSVRGVRAVGRDTRWPSLEAPAPGVWNGPCASPATHYPLRDDAPLVPPDERPAAAQDGIAPRAGVTILSHCPFKFGTLPATRAASGG